MDIQKTISFFKEKTYYSLALYQTDEHIFVDGLLISIQNDGELDILEKDLSGTLEDFFTNAKPKHPVVFNFSGVGTTSKVVENKGGYLKKVLFRSDPDDFYFYELHQNEEVFISLARRDLIDGLLDSFAKKGFFVPDFSIGPFVLDIIHKSFPEFHSLSNRRQRLVYEKDQLFFEENPGTGEEIYQIENEGFTKKNLPALAGILEYLYGKQENRQSNPKLKSNSEEFKYKRLLYKAGPIALGFLLLMLLAGHFIKKHYEQKYTEFKSASLHMEERLSLLKNLESEISNKEKILQASGFDAIGYLSKYSSQIVNSVPGKIVLNFLEVQPLTGRIKPDEQILLKNKFIEAGGTSSDEIAFTEWIGYLNLKPWIEKLEILNYEKEKDGLTTFVISIKIKHE